ncbi:MAG: hypothetical protein V1698_00440 [bacterium]
MENLTEIWEFRTKRHSATAPEYKFFKNMSHQHFGITEVLCRFIYILAYFLLFVHNRYFICPPM